MYMVLTEDPGHFGANSQTHEMMTARWVLHCILMQESKSAADLLSPPADLSCTMSSSLGSQLIYVQQCDSLTLELARLPNNDKVLF